MKRLRSELDTTGFAVLPNMMDPGLAVDLALQATKVRPFYTYDGEEYVDGSGASGGRSVFNVIAAPEVVTSLPPLAEWYQEMRLPIGSAIERELILSPHEMSAINVMMYPPGSGEVGWHFDTQPFTVLLFLTHGSPTEVKTLEGRSETIYPEPGLLLLMEGRECMHRVLLQPRDAGHRVSVPFNYYYPGDTGRPDYVDERSYSNKVE